MDADLAYCLQRFFDDQLELVAQRVSIKSTNEPKTSVGRRSDETASSASSPLPQAFVIPFSKYLEDSKAQLKKDRAVSKLIGVLDTMASSLSTLLLNPQDNVTRQPESTSPPKSETDDEQEKVLTLAHTIRHLAIGFLDEENFNGNFKKAVDMTQTHTIPVVIGNVKGLAGRYCTIFA